MAAANTPNINDVITEFGPFKETRAKEIFKAIMKDTNIEKFMTHVPNVDGGVYRMLYSLLTEITQPFQDDWTPKGTLSFIPNEIYMRRAKVDNEFTVDHLVNGWMSFLTTEGTDRKQWPITKWIINMIGELVQEEHGLVAVNGVYNPVTPGTAGGFLSISDGLLKFLNDFETADDGVNLIPIGNLDTDPYLKVHTFIRSMTKAEIRACNGQIFASTSMVDAVADDYIASNPNREIKWLGDTAFDHIIELPNTGKVKLVGVDGMDNSKRIWATPKANMLKIYNKVKGLNNFDIQKDKRKLLVLGDYSIGYGFGFKQLVWTNDAQVV